jgi:hypothetical protein
MYVRGFFILVLVCFFVVNTSLNVQQKNIEGLKPKIRKHTGTKMIFKPIENITYK